MSHPFKVYFRSRRKLKMLFVYKQSIKLTTKIPKFSKIVTFRRQNVLNNFKDENLCFVFCFN